MMFPVAGIKDDKDDMDHDQHDVQDVTYMCRKQSIARVFGNIFRAGFPVR